MCVLDPLKVVIENYEGEEEIDASYYPHDVPKVGSRTLPFSREIYIERDDFSENPIEGYYRLTPTQPVRLKHAYILTCKEIIKDKNGKIVEIKAVYHPDSKSGTDMSGIKTKSAIHWVSAKHAKKAEVRLYERLYKVDAPEGLDDLNPDSLHVIKNAFIEPAVVTEKPDVRFQFERQGYFYADPIDYTDEKPVFNKIVGLKDSWAKKSEPAKSAPKTESKKAHVEGDVAPMSDDEKARFEAYTKSGLNSEIANTLARDAELSRFYEATLLHVKSPTSIANIVANDVARELKREVELKFGAKEVAELVAMMDEGVISSKIAKQVFETMAQTGENPTQIVETQGLKQISDPALLKPLIDEVIAKNPDNVAKYKAGNTNLFGFFVGLVLKNSGGKANPSVVNSLVGEALK
jgi:glutaminyl-tRNA synthetase